uniref:Uncharacterized protein n=2 Tax=unclassified Microvirus TaxID=338099 RepID=A0AAU8B1U8_9VIRU
MAKISKSSKMLDEVPSIPGDVNSIFYKLYLADFATRLYADGDRVIDFHDAYYRFTRELKVDDFAFLVAIFNAVWPEPYTFFCSTYDLADNICAMLQIDEEDYND